MTKKEKIAYLNGYLAALEELHDESFRMHDMIADAYNLAEKELRKVEKEKECQPKK